MFDEHPSGPHSGESVLRFPNTQTTADIILPISVSQVEQLLRTGIVRTHACRVLLLSVYVFTDIIKLFSHWYRQKVMCIKSKRNQEKEQPQRRPKLTQEHHCYSWQTNITGGVRSIRKRYFSVYPPEVRLSGIQPCEMTPWVGISGRKRQTKLENPEFVTSTKVNKQHGNQTTVHYAIH